MTAREQADEAASTLEYTTRWLERITAAREALGPHLDEPRCEQPHAIGLALAQLNVAEGRLLDASERELREAQELETQQAFQPEQQRYA